MVTYLFIVLMLLGAPASAHEWLELDQKWCCNEKDCKAHPREAVTRTLGGWIVEYNKQFFPDGAPLKDGDPRLYYTPRSAPGSVWICHVPGEPKARCLFVLPEGS